MSKPYVFSMKMNGAQQKKTRAHTVDENTRIFLRSADTKSTVHTVNTHIAIDVDILIAIVGAISSATTCVSFTINETKKELWVKFWIGRNFWLEFAYLFAEWTI